MGWRRRVRAKLKGKRNPHARMLQSPAFRQKRVEGERPDRMKWERNHPEEITVDSYGEYGYGEDR